VLLLRTRLCCNALNLFVLQGVDLEYLLWLQTTFGASIGRATVEQVCQMYIKPRTSRSRGSVAQELAGSARTRRHLAPASWFISHTWGNAFVDTLAAVLLFFEGREGAASAFLWLDFLVTPQHASAGPSKPSSWLMTTFKSSIARIGSLLLVVDAWDNPAALKRAWYVAADVLTRAGALAADALTCAGACWSCMQSP
jgi:hypothetical protein